MHGERKAPLREESALDRARISAHPVAAEAERMARERAVTAGADPTTLKVVDVEDLPLAYLPGNAVRARVRVVGEIGELASR